MALDNSIFKKPPAQPNFKLRINSEGLDRSGKTNFALSAPGPIGVLALDRNTLEMTIKAQQLGKEIYVADFCDPSLSNPLHKYAIPAREEGGKPIAKEKIADKKFYEERWDAISDAYYSLIKEPSIKTIIIDTASQAWEDIRLSRFGKLKGIIQRDYGDVNDEMRRLLLSPKCHLIVTHRLKKMYKDSNWDGKSYESVGYNGAAFDLQITMRHESSLITDPEDKSRKKAQFRATVMNCSQDGSLMGLELSDEDCTFGMLAQMVYPSAPDGIWE